MSGYGDLSLRPQRRYARTMAAIGVPAAAVAAVLAACGVGQPPVWGIVAVAGLLWSALFGAWLRRRLDAGPDGLRMRSFLRWRRLAWDDITGFALVEKRYPRGGLVRRIEAGLRDRRPVALALPYDGAVGADPDLEETLSRLRALHRLHAPGTAPAAPVPGPGRREASRVRFVRTRVAPLVLCVVAAAGAGYVSVEGVAPEERRERAWQEAEPCPGGGPVEVRADCVSTQRAMIDRTVAEWKADSWLYFVGGRPVERLEVSRDTADSFVHGDRVTLTWWRGDLMAVASAEVRADEDTPRPGQSAVMLCLALLAAGGYAVYWLTRRGRSGESVGPGDQAEPSGLMYVLPIGWTALWAVPLAGFRPSWPVAVGVAVGGGLVALVLAVLALRVSGRRLGDEVRDLPVGEDVFLPASFLDDTPYNPSRLGTWIVLGAGPMAVVPHAGPGRFAGKEIPADRLTVLGMRRPREGESVSAGWYVADLLDGDSHVRLAARPANLMLLLRALEAAGAARAAPDPSSPAAVTDGVSGGG